MRKFDTLVQHIKYKALREVARQAWAYSLTQNAHKIPKVIIPGKKPSMRCCVHKERAILHERVALGMGGDKNSNRVIEVIDIACEECPMGGYDVTKACRGCLAHRCDSACRFGAISFDHEHHAQIDKSKCRECGACAQVCPYSAIQNYRRPCESACKVNAIYMGEDRQALIDSEKCISCGACVYNCPFGAISDVSSILDAIRIIQDSDDNISYKVFAIVAPSISSQFTYAKLGQVISGIRELGFHTVVEAALGADIVAQAESKELAEKGFLTSSCCPAFVTYIEKNFPELTPYISHNLSPMATIAKCIKERIPQAKTIFIGPCTAKKAEVKREEVRPYVDAVLTFEELQALFASRDIDITVLKESKLDNASYFGRIFARCGGLAEAVAQSLKEQNIDFDLKPLSCDGIAACRAALLQKKANRLEANFIEGMACVGGCIGGAGCLTHGPRDRAVVEKFGREAQDRTISDAIANMP